MTNSTIAHQRLYSQRFGHPDFDEPGDVVRWMGAMQAQDYHQALWAVGVRTRSATQATIEQAIADGKIVRTWPMRGTIHFVPPEDAHWMLTLTASRMLAKDTRRQAQLELTPAILARCQTLFYNALNGGRRLSRSAMLKVLQDAGISTEAQRGYHILWFSAQVGLICIGPTENKEQTFALLDDHCPNARQLSHEGALIELCRRYFVSHGPSTIHDFAWWSGLTVTKSRTGLEAIKDGLVSEKIDGKEFWMTPDTVNETTNSRSAVVLLPGYDEYLLGYQKRDAVLDPQHSPHVCPGGNGIFFPMIVSDGQIVGTWKRVLKKNTVIITRKGFTTLSSSDAAAFETAALRYGAFLGRSITFA